MAESFGAGGPSGSSGLLSSTMRSIVRQSGDPHDRDSRRVEDVVDLSPLAAQRQETRGPVEPPEASDSLRNPSSHTPPAARLRADDKADEADEAEAAAREARAAQREADGENVDATAGPVNIGMAAAIAIGVPEMVRRFDTNGDEHLDQVERERALETVQTDTGVQRARGGGPLFDRVQLAEDAPPREQDAGAPGQGETAYAEMQARRAESAQRLSEAEAKAERARAERLAALDEQAADRAAAAAALSEPAPPQAPASAPASAPAPGAGSAYARSEDLGQPHPTPRAFKA
ncbi:hypothetical protein [Roseospira goensis]|uniref:Uncharacterized protein n=1 Tax=Roseospira goensis TaxID=391922 RepID=A0A7W6WIR1_9PROT|nr:hypothetical protein [Roseospira goensis]MBB4284491.1 hypothetical protein [Roseospira goensis]